MEHSRALIERDPDNVDCQRELAHAYSNLGTLARERRRPDEALACFESGAAIEQRLLASRASVRITARSTPTLAPCSRGCC